MEYTMASDSPISCMPTSDGWNNISGIVNLSLFIRIICRETQCMSYAFPNMTLIISGTERLGGPAGTKWTTTVDRGFPREVPARRWGCQPITGPNFPGNCTKKKKIWPMQICYVDLHWSMPFWSTQKCMTLRHKFHIMASFDSWDWKPLLGRVVHPYDILICTAEYNLTENLVLGIPHMYGEKQTK